jgi:excisionase family DNA binding protein
MEVKLYSIEELTKILNLHPKTILRFIHEGKIAANKIGRSWRISEGDLKAYCHNELSDRQVPAPSPRYDTLKDRIRISAVIEISEQNSEEASRISNSIMAMLNSDKESDGKSRFDFFYYPDIEKAKYVFYGSSQFISRIIESFEVLCGGKGEGNE